MEHSNQGHNFLSIELGLIINSFLYNTGSWQPPKSLSRHQRRLEHNVLLHPQRSKTTRLTQFSYTRRDRRFQSILAHHSKVGWQQPRLKRHILKRYSHITSFDSVLTTPLKFIRFRVLSLTHPFFPPLPPFPFISSLVYLVACVEP